MKISSLEQDSKFDGQIFLLGNYFSAGNPPLVLVVDGKYQFPARSGIPLNVTSFVLKLQKIEIPIHSKLYFHSIIDEMIHDLRQLHYNLLNNEIYVSLPKHILLFEFIINEFK